MDNLLLKAVKNNASWCDHVVRKEGNTTMLSPLSWHTTQPVPEFYPNLITLKKDLTKGEIEEINKTISSIPLKNFAIKDSFSELEIKDIDFSEIFSASWIAFDNKKTPDSSLKNWKAEEDSQNKDIRYVVKLLDAKPISGFITNISHNVIGVTNVFHKESDKNFWEECISFIRLNISTYPIVGYEHGKELELAKKTGFDELGKLRVLRLVSVSG